MKFFKPSFFIGLKNYSKKQFVNDLIAGIIVAIIALPLSIALAIASGVGPAVGLYTAIVAGFVCSFLGGSSVQISGPTAAFATIVAGIVATKGIEGLAIATILAGIMLILMGVFKLGALIKFIPYTITTGFTSGIAVTILIGQLKDFFGLTFNHSPVETLEKLIEVVKCFGSINLWAVLVGLIALAILIFLPKLLPRVPPSLVAVIVCALVVGLFDLPVNTIGTLYPDISSAPPAFTFPKNLSLATITDLLPDAFTIAILAAVESLLSCVVADGMVGTRHNSNTELIAQGVGNIGSALFGGIPATGAIARTAANVKNGGRTPVSGMVHAIVLFAMLVILMPYAKLIPMPAIAAILFITAYNMSEWREFVGIIKAAPATDYLVLIATFLLTVIFDLVVAIVAGLVLALVLFMKKMSDETSIEGWKTVNDENDPEAIRFKSVPRNTMVYEITGPIFFGAADKLTRVISQSKNKVVIIRMRSVPVIDATGIHSFEALIKTCHKKGITLIMSHVNEKPMKFFHKAGIYEEIGEENFCDNIDDALARAAAIIEAK
ncbi:MAG: STAS domain-containing protein [Ruminococcaceae bacterium]|nr:STAS domain-containing protein [Oscillospiraceae bacterium]